MNDRTRLIWSPTYEYVADRIRHHRQLRILIAPFIKHDALEKLLSICDDVSALSIIVRWSGRDIVSGVSDLSIYPYLANLRIPLYVHPDIHLKLFIFDDVLAFHTSGNITQRGLGLSSPHNIEIGCQIELSPQDWRHVFDMLGSSIRVDQGLYDKACRYRDENASSRHPLPRLILKNERDMRFSRLSLPSSPDPEALYQFYQSQSESNDTRVEVAAFTHDLALYHVPEGLGRPEFFELLRARFTSQAFTLAIVALIREAGSARFGLMNNWITTNCSDNPTPYRWEMKAVTRRLYDWLAYFFDEISWDVPGSHSMVIRWK